MILKTWKDIHSNLNKYFVNRTQIPFCLAYKGFAVNTNCGVKFVTKECFRLIVVYCADSHSIFYSNNLAYMVRSFF